MHSKKALKGKLSSLAIGVASLFVAISATAYETTVGDTKVVVGGYIKFDALVSRFSEGAVAGNSPARDFFLPGVTPVTPAMGSGVERTYVDFHAKETRVYVSTDSTIDGNKVGLHIEADFLSNPGNNPGAGDERLANSYTLALRRAFVTFNNFTFGQDWSSFQNLAAVPETLNFVPWPSEGTVFSRQALVRYTLGGLDLSLENPLTNITTAMGTRIVSDESLAPDAVVRYRFKLGSAKLSAAGIVRQLRSDGNDGDTASNSGVDDTAIGFGVSFAGTVPFEKDDIRFTVTAGEGLGRYVALNAVNEVQIDGDEIDPITTLNGFVAYRHLWTEQWRSTATLSAFEANHDVALTGGGVTKSLQSASINLLYSPTPKLTMGTELRYAQREVEDGRKGDLSRLQVSLKYML